VARHCPFSPGLQAEGIARGLLGLEQKEAFASLRTIIRAVVDDIRTTIMENKGYVYIPEFR